MHDKAEHGLETRPIPIVARKAFRMLREDFERRSNELARDTLEAMGLDVADGWVVRVDLEVAQRSRHK